MVYDVTSSNSFANLEEWVAIVRKTFEGQRKMPVIGLVANKGINCRGRGWIARQ